jgi:hypothetical protein
MSTINRWWWLFPGQAILSVGIRQNLAGIRSGCMQFRSYPTIGIRLKGFRQLTAEIRPRLFGSDGIRLGIIDLGWFMTSINFSSEISSIAFVISLKVGHSLEIYSGIIERILFLSTWVILTKYNKSEKYEYFNNI